jgi:hypothetical protein
VAELGLKTHALLREIGNPAGARIVLETERSRAPSAGEGRPPIGRDRGQQRRVWTATEEGVTGSGGIEGRERG